MTLEFKKPEKEADYLNGVVRHINVNVNATTVYTKDYNYTNIIGSNYYKYWHSKYDTTYSQYAQIDFINKYVFAKSYMFSTGYNNDNNVPFYPTKWRLICSPDMKSWHTIDTRSGIAQRVNQKFLLDIQTPSICRSIRIHINGPDSSGRGYAYSGPIKFFGTVTSAMQMTYLRKRNTIFFSFLLILLTKS